MEAEKDPQISATPLILASLFLIIFNLMSVLRIVENTKDATIKGTVFEEILKNMLIDHFTMIILGIGLIVFASSFNKNSTNTLKMKSTNKDSRDLFGKPIPAPIKQESDVVEEFTVPKDLIEWIDENGQKWKKIGETLYWWNVSGWQRHE
tara:strand:- start:129 stop:578 length:450 start_codon:yes stop_codon:yes gene_type:complete